MITERNSLSEQIITNAEKYAIKVENRIREEHKIPQREYYIQNAQLGDIKTGASSLDRINSINNKSINNKRR